jgi:hypothetical protein
MSRNVNAALSATFERLAEIVHGGVAKGPVSVRLADVVVLGPDDRRQDDKQKKAPGWPGGE